MSPVSEFRRKKFIREMIALLPSILNAPTKAGILEWLEFDTEEIVANINYHGVLYQEIKEFIEANRKKNVRLNWLKIEIQELFNRLSLKANRKNWKKRYRGKLVAIYEGKILATRSTEEKLHQWLDGEKVCTLTGNILLHSFK